MKLTMKNKAPIGCFLLFLASFFWGSTFVAQSNAAEKLSSFSYLCARSAVGAAALFITIVLRYFFTGKKKEIAKMPQEKKKASIRRTVFGGVLCGLVLTAASYLQQRGIQEGATAGEAGFLTALYMFFVPLLSFLLFGKKVPFNLLPGSLLMAAGLYFLCIMDKGWSAFGIGHILMISCGLAYAVHILVIDRFGDIDGMLLSFIQFFVCACVSFVASLIFEEMTLDMVLDAWFPILYAGIFSSAIAFTLQIYGQKYAPPALSTIFMSLESVIALISEWLCSTFGLFSLSGTVTMTPYKALGCVLAFIGILCAQLTAFSVPFGRKTKKKQSENNSEK